MDYKFNVYIVKATSEICGTIYHKFASKKEVATYAKNPYIETCEIVRSFENLSYNELNEICFKKPEEILNL